MRVLVTGHGGYIGTVLVPMFLKAGHEVVGLDTHLYRSCTFGAEPVAVPEIVKDLRDVEASDLKGFDAVVHLAALSNDPLGNLDPQLTFDINHLGSVRLARKAKEAGVPRFLFSSSCSTYGSAGDDMLDETSSFNPVTPYGQSKVLVERDLSALADGKLLPGISTECHGVRGFSQAAFRPGAEQPGGVCHDHRPGADEERWHAVASDCAHRRYFARLSGADDGAERTWSAIRRLTSASTRRTTAFTNWRTW